MRNKYSFKSTLAIFGIFAMLLFISSCSRGGYGCPGELEIITDVVTTLAK